MRDRSYLILDKDDNRRSEVYRAFASQRRAIPLEDVGELGAAWPEYAWFFVHDDPELLAELQRTFAERQCYHPIVVYSESLVPSRIVSAIYGGAVNYVVWPSDIATIERSNDKVSDMARRRCEYAATRLLAQSRVASLSAREAEIIREVRKGLTNKEIAHTLGISPRTVEIHRANALIKLCARNSADATRILIQAEDGLEPLHMAA